ncbi:hypothetical protein ACEPAF_8798 [Sanghuangporus sanghuang]
MAPNANANRKVAASSGRNVRNASIKKSNTGTLGIDDLDPIVQPSQSSSDDGMMATIAQKMQTSMEKRKKEREVRFLQAAQLEFSRILSEKAHELQDGVAEIDKIYSSFQDAYVANEDNIRRLWTAILEEQLKLHDLVDEKHRSTIEDEKCREKDHIQALAHCRKACEGRTPLLYGIRETDYSVPESQRLIDLLEPN